MKIKKSIYLLWKNFRYWHFDKKAFELGLISEPINPYNKTHLFSIDEMFESIRITEEAKENHPILYKLLVGLPDFIENLPSTPSDIFGGIRRWFFYTFILRKNVIKLRNLPSGHWYEADTRMTEALSQILIDFVEVDCAAMMGDYDFNRKPDAKLGIKYIKFQQKHVPSAHKNWQNVLDAYKYFKKGRAKLVKNAEKTLETWHKGCKKKSKSLKKSQSFDAHLKAEELLYETDTKYYSIIIQERQRLWT